jgi:hypothetical protein
MVNRIAAIDEGHKMSSHSRWLRRGVDGMNILGFRTREPKRDDETDRRRSSRLCAAIRKIELEVRSELTGLEARFRTASVRASFLLEAIENGQIGSDARLEELTHTIIACDARARELSRQADFLAALNTAAASLASPTGLAEVSHSPELNIKCASPCAQ